MAQSAVLGVLLVGPLLYTQALPLVTVVPPITIIHDPPPPPPPVRQTERPAATPGATLGLTRRAFVSPTRVPTGPVRTGIVDIDLGPADLGESVVATAGIATALPGATFVPVPPSEPPAPPAAKQPEPPKLIRLSEGVLRGKLVTMVKPAYPVIAKQARVSGTVRLLAIIGKDGRVRDLRVIEGHAMLRQAAFEAVKQWVYSPTLLTGQPVEIEAPIEVNFTLQ